MFFKVRVFNSRQGKKSFALIVDLGYTVKYVNFDANLIAEILHISVQELYDKVNGDYDIKVK